MSNFPHRTIMAKTSRYYIYNDGRVQNRNTRNTLETYWDNRAGCLYVNLQVPKRSDPHSTYTRKFPLARLVWEAFYGERASNHATIVYLDGDAANCAIDNLAVEKKTNYGKRVLWDEKEGEKVRKLIEEGKGDDPWHKP